MSRPIARPDSPLVLQAPAAVGRVHTPLHPWAWWVWALGAVVAITLTTNPLLIMLIVMALIVVVLTRRSEAPWARSVGTYLKLALVIVAIRLFFQILVGNQRDGLVLFTLPSAQLPDWAAGITLGGAVTLNGVLYSLYAGLQLGAIIACVGAANALANPRRALKSVPAALYEISVAVVIAITLAPQLITSLFRVRRARRLRGGAGHGWRAVKAVLVPVLEDAVNDSLQLAAGMEARGFGRTRSGQRAGWADTLALLGGSVLVVLATFTLLGGAGTATVFGVNATALGWALVVIGVGLAALGIGRAGRRLGVTRYRPQPWTATETLIALGALATIVATALVGLTPGALHPTTTPLSWPPLPLTALAVPAALLLPLLVTTPVPLGSEPGAAAALKAAQLGTESSPDPEESR